MIIGGQSDSAESAIFALGDVCLGRNAVDLPHVDVTNPDLSSQRHCERPVHIYGMFNPLEIPTKSSSRVQLRLEQHGNDQKGQQRQMVGARILMLLASSVHLESKCTHSHLETKGKISEVALILPFLQAALYNVFQSYENLFISFQRSSSHVFMMLLFQFLYSSLHRRLRLTEIFGGVTLHLQCPHLSAYRTVR